MMNDKKRYNDFMYKRVFWKTRSFSEGTVRWLPRGRISHQFDPYPCTARNCIGGYIWKTRNKVQLEV